MTDTDLEDRLRRYGAHLNNVTETPSTSELVAVEPRHRARRLLAVATAVAAAITTVALVDGGDRRSLLTQVADQPTSGSATPNPSEGHRLPRLAIEGWQITGYHSQMDLPGATARTGFVQSFRNPSLGFDGPGVLVVTQPTIEDWGAGQGARELTVQGQPAWLMRFSPLSALMTWHPGDGRLVALYGTRLSDDELTDIAQRLRPVDAGWQVSSPAFELSELNSGSPAPLQAMAETDLTGDGGQVQLRQQLTSIIEFETLVQDRITSAASLRQVTVAGEPAALVRYVGGAERWTAMWYANGVAHELDGNTREEEFLSALASVRQFDEAQWLSLLPPSVVAPDEREGAVTEMLSDIPIPPGFDTAHLHHSLEPIERYQLGATVTGAIVCAWTDRADDDARAAMRDVRNWQVLREMVDEGDYSEAVWEAADGWLTGSTDARQVRNALGCD